MASDKFVMLSADEVEPTAAPQEQAAPPDTLNKIATILVLITMMGGFGFGGFWVGGYYAKQPSFAQARAEIARVAGEEAAEAFSELPTACRDDMNLKTACRVLYMDGRKNSSSQIASAKVKVPE